MCDLELDLEALHFPRADLPENETPARRLRQVTLAGARRRYGELNDAVRRRIDRELDVIRKLDFCDYFLVVHDISRFAERRGIPHVGRGSAGNSVVSYCLGISAVDPLAFDLYFERFLNEHRTDVPDIDIDFCWRRRDEVIDYVYERYGADRVAMVSTHSTLRARSAFRDVARVMGLPLDDIDALSRKLPHYAASSIEEARETFPEMSDFPIDEEPWSTVVSTALRIDGYVRHLGIHLGGLVIADRPLTRYTALEDSTKGIVVTQYEMDSIEEIGLVKMDILGQRSLSIVDEAARNVAKLRGVELDLDGLPEGDERTSAVLRHGRTMGCFQIESPGMRQLLQMLHARDIMGLIQALSLIRPGPSSSGMKQAFIRRMRGREPVTYDAPGMERALSGTYGVMLYQEDILRVAQEVAGFTLAQGDELRKAISKNRSREAVARFREQFVEGAVGRGVERGLAEQIWEQIRAFAAYSYCKAHACTYGHISYQATYLKAHWPAEFIASVVANKAGFYDPRTYFEEARRFNVRLLAPCVNESRVETQPDPGPEPAIRPGLEFVKSLTAATTRRILEHRAARPFDSLLDLHLRARPNRTEMENLVVSGTLDSLERNRPTLLMQMERLPEQPPPEGRLFEPSPGYDTGQECAGIDVPEQPPYSLSRRVMLELQTLGFSHSGHATDAWSEALERCARLTPSYQVGRRVNQRIRYAGWLVTTRRAVTKESRYMRFLTLEDRHGVVEVVLFPDVYRRCGKQIAGAGVYLVQGRVKEQNGATSIVAEDLQALPAGG
jgi:DNA-directed DNA polymerase III PolC